MCGLTVPAERNVSSGTSFGAGIEEERDADKIIIADQDSSGMMT